MLVMNGRLRLPCVPVVYPPWLSIPRRFTWFHGMPLNRRGPSAGPCYSTMTSPSWGATSWAS